MKRDLRVLAAAGTLLLALAAANAAFAQKQGGVLKIGQFDSPASMSIHEESSNTAEGPMMGVFNNLVLYDQHVAQNSMQTIRPDLATDWSWDEDRTRLTFHLHQGVRWHDGKPFTARDVQCTWDLLTGTAGEKLRLNPRKPWYRNLVEVIANGDYEVTFHLKQPQPALLALLASGWAPVRGQIHMIQPYTVTAPLLKDVKAQAPQAICELVPQNIYRDRGRPPFDNRDLRRAMALSLDRKAFIDILAEGQGDIGAAMLPPPEGRWGMPPEIVETLPGYGLDVQKNRAEARRIIEALGYGPDRRLAVKVSTRNVATAV